MKISTKGRYALRIMIYLAKNDTGEYISLKEISEGEDISIKYLENIISKLYKNGLVISLRGACGGYKLAKDASNYTAGEIIRAAEGSIAPIACLEDEINLCPRNKECETVKFWEGLYEVMNDYIDNFALEKFIEQ
ncbi:MAG: Rrf2 family transcriptional regulator [Eubacteriaceae bacterium]|nr:Rrf2 family transcriptional regulator [Eubacteriaceae bacterium]